MKEIRIPDIGDFHDVEVIDVLVKPGDRIDKETPLVTLETEKATMDVPATDAGVVKSVALKKGDRVSKGTVILQLEPAGDEAAEQAPVAKKADDQPSDEALPPSQPSAAPRASESEPAPVAEEANLAPAPQPASPRPSPTGSFPPVIDEPGFAKAHAGPSVRKLAREMGVDLSKVKGSGLKGRITHDDVKRWVKEQLATPSTAGAAPAVTLPQLTAADFAKFGEVETRPLGRIQKISGPRLHASWTTIPHVWQMDEADITEMEEARAKLKEEAAKKGIKLTPLAFILRACVKALQAFPNFNASLDSANQALILKKYIHLGFAADTPNGLVVPVIRDADQKDVYEIARELGTLSEKARAGKLSAAEMQGACFTVSSLGGIGGTAFTPIINWPEVAILGVARAAMKPVYDNGNFVPRLILPFTLAYDHRVIDGAQAVRFTTFLAERLRDVRGLLEAVP
jgi:pyruvate dehydrogenase E2 component (dihydrolipoamide acetyltransferase)